MTSQATRELRPFTNVTEIRTDSTSTRATLRQRIGEEIGCLGQLIAGLADPRELHLDADRAGFGSVVHVEDVASGESAAYTLMTGTTVDVTRSQVSIDSPIGSALLGALPGTTVRVETPLGARRLRVLHVRTLLERFG